MVRLLENGDNMLTDKGNPQWGRVDLVVTNLAGDVALIIELKSAYIDPTATAADALQQAFSYRGLVPAAVSTAINVRKNINGLPEVEIWLSGRWLMSRSSSIREPPIHRLSTSDSRLV